MAGQDASSKEGAKRNEQRNGDQKRRSCACDSAALVVSFEGGLRMLG